MQWHRVGRGEGHWDNANTTVPWASQDNDFHVDFVAAAASLRAQNYGIPPADRTKVYPAPWGSGLEVGVKP